MGNPLVLGLDDENQVLTKGLGKTAPKSFVLTLYKAITSQNDNISNSTNTVEVNYLSRAFDVETKYGHDFLWIPIALISGAYFNLTRQNDIPHLAILIPIASISCLLPFARTFSQRTKFLIIITLSFLFGNFAANVELGKSTSLLDQDLTTDVTGYVISRQMNANGTPRYQIMIEQTANPQIRRPPEIVQLVARSKHELLEIGEVASGRVKLTRPSGPVFPGGFDFAFNAYTKNIGAYGYFMGAPVKTGNMPRDQLTLKMRFELFVRQTQLVISGRIRAQLAGDPSAIASALIVADRRAISEESVSALREAGLAHVLAISGLHMVLASGTLFLTLRFLLSLFPSMAQAIAIKKLAAFGAIGAATAYLMISGAPISAQRAWIMLMIILVAVIVDRPAITLRNVAIAAIIIVLISPSAVMTPGFQMSFAAAAALVAVYNAWSRRRTMILDGSSFYRDEGLIMRFVRGLIGLAMTALIAGLATGIFSSQHFYSLAGYGVLGNVLAMPIVTFLVMPLALLSVLLMPYGLETLPLLALGQSIQIVIDIATWVSSLGGQIQTGKPIYFAAASMTIGFIIFVCMRSSMKYFGIGLIAIGLASNLWLELKIPDILISEDGKLIALRDQQTIYVNRNRPSKFIIEQWENAYKLVTNKPLKPFKKSEAIEILERTPDTFWPVLNPYLKITSQQFTCINSNFCIALTNGQTIATIGKKAYLPLVCDKADIIVATFGISKKTTDCGTALIFDRYSLKQSGSVAIHTKSDKNSNDSTSASNKLAQYEIVTAIDNTVRPWTIQIYFSWRNKIYYLPDGQRLKYIDGAIEQIAPPD